MVITSHRANTSSPGSPRRNSKSSMGCFQSVVPYTERYLRPVMPDRPLKSETPRRFSRWSERSRFNCHNGARSPKPETYSSTLPIAHAPSTRGRRIGKDPRGVKLSGREDLNLRPFGPEPNALPDCATPRGWNMCETGNCFGNAVICQTWRRQSMAVRDQSDRRRTRRRKTSTTNSRAVTSKIGVRSGWRVSRCSAPAS